MKSKTAFDGLALLVEDFQIDVNATLPLLKDVGYHSKNIHVSENIDDAVQFLKRSKPELVILDLEVPQSKGSLRSLDTGLSFLRSLVSEYDNRLQIIVYSRYPNLGVVYQVIALGISFMAKQDYNKEFFSAALNQIKQGHLVVSSSVLPNLRQMFRSALRVGMDEEDRQILRRILIGTTDRDIGIAMGYSEDWVSGRLRRMFKSFGFKTRDELAIWFRDYVAPIFGYEVEVPREQSDL